MSALVVFGTRPEVIKLAPVCVALRRCMEVVTVFTGQQRDVGQGALRDVGELPDRCLPPGSLLELLGDKSGALIRGLEEAILAVSPDFVVVQGDTLSAFAGAFAAFLHCVPVVHVEAGLRTHDLEAPWPEEGLRQMISRVARLHFAPTLGAYQNLRKEGVDDSTVWVVGNTIADAVRIYGSRAGSPRHCSEWTGPRIVVTAHRRENQGEPLRDICSAAEEIARRHPEALVLFVGHPNPAVLRTVLHESRGWPGNLRLVSPMGYLEFLAELKVAALVITDSGGVQEEAACLGVPLVVTRKATERAEALVVLGKFAKLVGTDSAAIIAATEGILKELKTERARQNEPFGDGHAAERIACRCAEYFLV